jgi:hypothetical protein
MKFRREHTLAMEALVVYLRFGSLSEPSRAWLKATEVFQKTGIKDSSQYNIIKRWLKRGCNFIKPTSGRGLKPMLSEE